jgi:cytochrome c peroxidase
MRYSVQYARQTSKLTLLATLVFLAFGIPGTSADFVVFDWRLPQGFRPPPVPSDNPMNEAEVPLGRRLFYDQRMSINGKGSCSTCHLQQFGFSNQKQVAEGVTGEKHPRRAMSLANVAYFTAFNWANPTVKNLSCRHVLRFLVSTLLN